jgi:hypothetical protein
VPELIVIVATSDFWRLGFLPISGASGWQTCIGPSIWFTPNRKTDRIRWNHIVAGVLPERKT